MTSEEVYVVVKDNPKYEVSNYGNVRKIIYNPSNKILKPIKTNYGYYKVNLDIDESTKSRNRKFKQYLLSRLVADHFMENFDSTKQVHYIDKNNANCRIDNLYQ